MRKMWNLAAAAALLTAASVAQARGPECAAPACAAPAPACAKPAPTCAAPAEPTCAAVAAAGVAGVDGCCDDGCGNGRRGPKYDGLDPYFNCGCNGSYKFPVPPLYTYHWPGMYQQHLMTDYHSPWRFPPLKPYVDEVPPVEMGRIDATRRIRPVSHLVPFGSRTSAEPESMSSRMAR